MADQTLRLPFKALAAALTTLLAAPGCADDANGPQAPRPDAPITQPPGIDTCDGNCAIFAVQASKGSAQIEFDRGYFGVTMDPTGDSLHIELYRGGDQGCPTESSATPEQTLIISRLPIFTTRDPLALDDGIASSIIDFTGDLSDQFLPSGAAMLTIEPNAVSLAAPRFVAFDVEVHFDNGITATGHVYATHCPSMDASS